MNTLEILKLALNLAGMKETPPDSGVLVPGEKIKRVAIGIDMEAPEIMLAKELGADAVISHHPKGGLPMVNFHKVMYRQIDRMVEAGVPINKAQKVLAERVEQVDRAHHVGNYGRVTSAAKALQMPYLIIHSPADVLAENLIQQRLDKNLQSRPKALLADVLEILEQIPEFRNSLVKPLIRVGNEKSYAGRVFAIMAGGTNGGANVAKAYFEAGIGTLVAMHMPEDVLKEIRNQGFGNVIVAGHMPCDSIGINLIVDVLEQKGLEVIRLGGLIER